MKVLMLNTHSVLNSGDAGIVLAQIQLLRRRYHDLEITLTSRTPETDGPFYGRMGIKVLPPLFPVPSVFDGMARRIGQSIRNLLDVESKKRLLKEMKTSNLIISSGGGYFWTNRPIFPGPMFLQNIVHVKIANCLKKPILFFPQSFGPFYNSTASKLLKNVLEGQNVTKVFAREQTSLDLLHRLLSGTGVMRKVDLCPDMAYCLGREKIESGSPLRGLTRPVLALTLRQWDFPEGKGRKDRRRKKSDYLSSLETMCGMFFSRWQGSVVIFPQVRGPGAFENDRIISKLFFERLRGVLPERNILFVDLPDAAPPSSIIDLLSQVDLTVATRFHSAVYALLAGTPVMTINYQPKGEGIMAMQGLEQFSTSISDMNPERLIVLIEEILNHPDEIRLKINERVSLIRKSIEAKMEGAFQAVSLR